MRTWGWLVWLLVIVLACLGCMVAGYLYCYLILQGFCFEFVGWWLFAGGVCCLVVCVYCNGLLCWFIVLIVLL